MKEDIPLFCSIKKLRSNPAVRNYCDKLLERKRILLSKSLTTSYNFSSSHDSLPNKLSLKDLTYGKFLEKIVMGGQLFELYNRIVDVGPPQYPLFDSEIDEIIRELKNKEFPISEVKKLDRSSLALENIISLNPNTLEIIQHLKTRCHQDSISFSKCLWKVFSFDLEEEMEIKEALNTLYKMDKKVVLPYNHQVFDFSRDNEPRLHVHYKTFPNFRVLLKIDCPREYNQRRQHNLVLYELEMSMVLDKISNDEKIILPCDSSTCRNAFTIKPDLKYVKVSDKSSISQYSKHRKIDIKKIEKPKVLTKVLTRLDVLSVLTREFQNLLDIIYKLRIHNTLLLKKLLKILENEGIIILRMIGNKKHWRLKKL